jgi:hypothetical protein
LLVNVEVLLGDILGCFLLFKRAFAVSLGGFGIGVGVCKLVVLLGLVIKGDDYLGLRFLGGLLRLLHLQLRLVGLSLPVSQAQVEFGLLFLLIRGDLRLYVL